jgi:mono/diheme cytochrome c family protein
MLEEEATLPDQTFNLQSAIFNPQSSPCLPVSVVSLVSLLLTLLTACSPERRKSDAELGLNPQQAAGRAVYDQYCGRCHEPYSSRGKQGSSLKGVFKKQYLSLSGLPANDERVGEIVRYGRSKMPSYGQTLDPQQIDDLLAYMHTL